MTILWQNMKILGSSCVLPERQIANKDVVNSCISEASPDFVELEAARIARQTGILTRRYALPEQCTSDLAALALQPLLSMFDTKNPLSGVLVATTSPDVPSPATANWLHRKCGLSPSVHAFDVASSCSSSLSALRAASGFVAAGQACAVVAAELKHKGLNPSDLRTRALFGDGAAGMALAPSNGNEKFLFNHVQVNSELAERIRIPVGGTQEPTNLQNIHRIYLEIQEPKNTYLATVKAFIDAVESLWEARDRAIFDSGMSAAEVGGFVYLHQANSNIIRDVKARLPSHISNRIPVLMSDVGNMVCASLWSARARSRVLECSILEWSLQVPWAQITPAFLREHLQPRGTITRNVWGEHVTVLDEARAHSGISSWVQCLQDEELETVVLACRFARSQNERQIFVDAWVAAGGGFQTVGCLHAKNLEIMK